MSDVEPGSGQPRPSDGKAPEPSPAAPDAASPAQNIKEESPSPISAFAGVVVSPSSTFASMRQSKWHFAIWPLAVLALLAGLATYLFMTRVDMEAFMRNQFKHSRFAAQMSAEQMDQAVEQAKNANPWTRVAINVPGTAIFMLLVALVYWVTFLAMGSAMTYGQTLVVTSWAQVPQMINSALASVVFMVRNPSELDPMNAVMSNPGALIGQESLAPWLYSLLSSMDLFAVWTIVLYVLGFAAVGKISKGQAASVVLAIFVLKTALKLAWAFFMQT